MRILELSAEGWRNLEPLRLAPGERLSVLYGDNGQGKTNVLEAVYYLAALRSFRTTRAEDLIRRGAGGGRARLRAEVVHRGLQRRFELELGPGGRTARLDGKLVRSTAAALGSVSVVLFVPEDLLLPRAAPAARRRFLDLAIFNVERGYYGEASAFQKVLRNRNALLKRREWDRTLLDAFDDELARTGARVVMRRRALAAALAPRFADHFHALHGDLPVSLAYRSDPTIEAAGDEEAVRAALLRGLADRRALDERRRFTGFGPQADDLEIGLSGLLARTHASQGQLRSLMLALKLAELTEVEARLGDPPILLLDDVPSELDPSRRGLLFEVITRLDCQTLISVTERELVPIRTDRRDFQVRAGTLTPIS
ncbi:MAG TPA: DNA replication and repair protein RecF [Polyangia bacterium]|nr:DNA replication and repair protein RecF [Polyangia bacterium]